MTEHLVHPHIGTPLLRAAIRGGCERCDRVQGIGFDEGTDVAKWLVERPMAASVDQRLAGRGAVKPRIVRIVVDLPGADRTEETRPRRLVEPRRSGR